MEVQKEDMRMGHYVQRRVSFIHGLLLMMKKKMFYVGERGEKHDGTKQAVIRKIAQEE